MLANFNKSMRVSILISAIAVGAVCVAGAVGIVQAVPEFNRVFDTDSTPPLLAHSAATLASGYFGTAVKPARYAMQDVNEFTDGYQSKMPAALAEIDYEAPSAALNPTRSAPQVIAAQADYKTMDRLLPTPVIIVNSVYHLKMQLTAAYRAIDARLDEQHLPSFKEHAILAHHECGISSTGSIES